METVTREKRVTANRNTVQEAHKLVQASLTQVSYRYNSDSYGKSYKYFISFKK